jgi:hypothetical protein
MQADKESPHMKACVPCLSDPVMQADEMEMKDSLSHPDEWQAGIVSLQENRRKGMWKHGPINTQQYLLIPLVATIS